jgi:hypothetical protein
MVHSIDHFRRNYHKNENSNIISFQRVYSLGSDPICFHSNTLQQNNSSAQSFAMTLINESSTRYICSTFLCLFFFSFLGVWPFKCGMVLEMRSIYLDSAMSNNFTNQSHRLYCINIVKAIRQLQNNRLVVFRLSVAYDRN